MICASDSNLVKAVGNNLIDGGWQGTVNKNGRRKMKKTALVLVVASWALSLTIDCSGTAAPPVRSQTATEEQGACLRCHSMKGIFGFDIRGRRKSVYVDPEAFARSVHSGLKCSDCHRDVVPQQIPHPRHLEQATCLPCHLERRWLPAPGFKDVLAISYRDSVHGRAVARGDPDAPTCADCHGHHNILPAKDRRSQIHRLRIPETCSRCHSDANLVEWHRIPKGETLYYYERSVHGQLLRRGVKGGRVAPGKEPAVCTDCHGVHGIRRGDDPEGKVARPHLPETCGGCHRGIEREWEEGVHGEGWRRGIKEAPVCTDCHGEHSIRSPKDPESQVHSQHIVATCTRCHEDEVIQRQIGLPTKRLETYRRSYHGILNRYGVSRVAHCGSCHGAHRILPSKDPRSPVHPANLVKTCGQCHPGIGKGVTVDRIHFAGTATQSLPYWVLRRLLQGIVLVIGFLFTVFIGIDLTDYLRRYESQTLQMEAKEEAGWVLRWTANERAQHIVLILSVVLLMISGLPLRYPESGWVQTLLSFPGTPQVRGIIHRIGAILLIAVVVWHLLYRQTKRGREQKKHLRWRRKDFSDLFQTILWHTGKAKEKPQFGRFTWAQKLMYHLTGFTVLIMIVTGLILWREDIALRYLPIDVIYLSRLIHSYEALLILLTVLIWHLYYVHLRPGVFPFSATWLTGKVSLKQMAADHPLDSGGKSEEAEL